MKAGDAIGRKAVEPAFLHLHPEYREGLRLEQFGAIGREPTQHLPLRNGVLRHFRRDLAGPRASRNDQASSKVCVLVGSYRHTAPGRWLPVQYRFAAVNLSSQVHCCGCVRDDAPLGEDEAALLLVKHLGIFGQLVAGPFLIDLRPAQQAIGQAVFPNSFKGTFEQLVHAHAAAHAPSGHQQLLAGQVFQLVPKLIGAVQQRDVGRVLMISQPYHAADAVGRPHLIGNVVPL